MGNRSRHASGFERGEQIVALRRAESVRDAKVGEPQCHQCANFERRTSGRVLGWCQTHHFGVRVYECCPKFLAKPA